MLGKRTNSRVFAWVCPSPQPTVISELSREVRGQHRLSNCLWCSTLTCRSSPLHLKIDDTEPWRNRSIDAARKSVPCVCSREPCVLQRTKPLHFPTPNKTLGSQLTSQPAAGSKHLDLCPHPFLCLGDSPGRTDSVPHCKGLGLQASA